MVRELAEVKVESSPKSPFPLGKSLKKPCRNGALQNAHFEMPFIEMRVLEMEITVASRQNLSGICFF